MEKGRARGFGTRERRLVRGRNLTHIGAILQDALQRLDYLPGVTRNRIWTEWEAIVGSTVSKVAKPERVQGSTLYVAVSDNSWMQHLAWVREGLLRQIQQCLGPNAITKLHFSLERGDCSSKEQPQGEDGAL